MLRTIFIKDWEELISTDPAAAAAAAAAAQSGTSTSCKWAYVQHLELLVEPVWPLLQATLARLPNLTHLRINTHLDERLPAPFVASGALAGLTRLDLGRADAVLPLGLQLPKLQALSFGGCYGRSAAAISAFAPNLQQLFCERLSFAATDDACLPHVTHFGACHMYVSCSASKWAGLRRNSSSTWGAGSSDAGSKSAHLQALLQPLLPSLQVLYRLPEISATDGSQPLLDLASPAVLQAVKGIGSLRNRELLQQLQQMTRLSRLALHSQLSLGFGGFAGISSLKSLQAVRLTGSCSSRGGADAAAVLPELLQLPDLRQAALAVELLCSSCCPAAAPALCALAGKRGLQRLVFLQLKPCGPTVERPHRRYNGCECQHSKSWCGGLAAVEAAAAAAASSAAAAGLCDPQQQLSVEVEAGEVWMDRHAWAARQDDASGAGGMWGEYGPAGEW
ncbi:hypothetical protein COO60DRAFT_1705215 [Scenedesmus sp. NREL 46B-D3]|nr:hypothetical protein COO60DRAFT_1705215 [Scenedesmus sp. NREL 46B-D3]